MTEIFEDGTFSTIKDKRIRRPGTISYHPALELIIAAFVAAGIGFADIYF